MLLEDGKREGEERTASGISFREDRGYWQEGRLTNLSTREERSICFASVHPDMANLESLRHMLATCCHCPLLILITTGLM